jgi:hypothetical protein
MSRLSVSAQSAMQTRSGNNNSSGIVSPSRHSIELVVPPLEDSPPLQTSPSSASLEPGADAEVVLDMASPTDKCTPDESDCAAATAAATDASQDWVSRMRRRMGTLDTKTCITLAAALINLTVILVLLINPIRAQLEIVKTEVAALQSNLPMFDYLQSANNISRISGMADLVQSQVLSLSSQSGVVHDTVADSTRQIATLNSTIARISRLIDLDVGFNGTVGNCIAPVQVGTFWGACGAYAECGTVLPPILQSNLTVMNPTITLDLFCRWKYGDGASPAVGTGLATTLIAQGQGNLLTFQTQADPLWSENLFHTFSTNITKSGLLSLQDLVLSIKYYSFLDCLSICVTVQY